MDVHVKGFSELVKHEWNYPVYHRESDNTQLVIRNSSADVSGGRLTKTDIDILSDYPDVKSVTVFGLFQDTFEYFIQTYGKQLCYINFFKNPKVEDWSLLSTLTDLECIYWFHNQKITKLWDMSNNRSLRAIVLDDFTKLHDLSGVEKAPALEWFGFGNAVWSTAEIDSLKPFCGTNIKRINFSGKKIRDMDISFIPTLEKLEVFDFPTNLFTTEEIAYLVAKCPDLKGYSLHPYIEFKTFDEETKRTDVPAVIIVGKRKPSFKVAGNEKRIDKYVCAFGDLVEKYKRGF